MSSRCLDIVNAHIVTLDESWTEISDGFLRIRDGVIVALGPMSEYSVGEERVEDARGSFVFPGLINTQKRNPRFSTAKNHINERAILGRLPSILDDGISSSLLRFIFP